MACTIIKNHFKMVLVLDFSISHKKHLREIQLFWWNFSINLTKKKKSLLMPNLKVVVRKKWLSKHFSFFFLERWWTKPTVCHCYMTFNYLNVRYFVIKFVIFYKVYKNTEIWDFQEFSFSYRLSRYVSLILAWLSFHVTCSGSFPPCSFTLSNHVFFCVLSLS